MENEKWVYNCGCLAWCKSVTGYGMLTALPTLTGHVKGLPSGLEYTGTEFFRTFFLFLSRDFHTSWSLFFRNESETLKNTDLYSWHFPYNYHLLTRFLVLVLVSHLSLSFIFCSETQIIFGYQRGPLFQEPRIQNVRRDLSHIFELGVQDTSLWQIGSLWKVSS